MSIAFVRQKRPIQFVLSAVCILTGIAFPQRLLAQRSSTPPQHTLDRPARASVNFLPDANFVPTYRCDDSDACDSLQDAAFELARENDLKSSDPDVVRAARAYGKGVTIEFRALEPGIQSETRHDVRGDGTAPNGLRAVETVIFTFNMPAAQLEAAIGHEGSHVADAQDFVKAISPTGKIDQSKNLSTYQTEFRAYMVTQSILASHKVRLGYGECGKEAPCHLGFGVAREQAIQTINELLANPANYCGVGPNYGVTPDNPGPALYEILTPPYLVAPEAGQSDRRI
ncbi:MAG: hypothetical protein ACYDCM_15495 [Candidatus Acidiferrales bacterium]